MITRRAFVGGAVAVVALGRPGAATARPARTLARARARTFRALVASARGCRDRRWKGARLDPAVRAFGDWYARAETIDRTHAEAVLDVVERAGGARAVLAADGDPAARAAALALVATVCEPPPEPDEHPVIPAMV